MINILIENVYNTNNWQTCDNEEQVVMYESPKELDDRGMFQQTEDLNLIRLKV